MKRTLFLALAAISLNSAAQAEITESNVVVQIKRLIQLPDTEAPNGIVTGKYTTVTFKTADLIQQIGIAKAISFSNKAKLLAVVTVTEASVDLTYVIRDGLTDTDVTNCIDIAYGDPVAGGEGTVTQFKGTKNPPLGTMKIFGYGTFKLKPNSTDTLLELHGPLNNSQRFIKSKEFEPMTFPIVNATLSGIGSFVLPPVNLQPNLGVAQGTFKVTGTKIIKTN